MNSEASILVEEFGFNPYDLKKNKFEFSQKDKEIEVKIPRKRDKKTVGKEEVFIKKRISSKWTEQEDK